MKLSGAQIVLKTLKDLGVDVLFGYPGGAVIPLYDALYEVREDFTHVRTSHEQGAAHAADGYARVTGKVGVCIATSGPGATNTVTGIANAYMDSIPMLVITGQVATNLIGKDSFQEIDITGVTIPITKHNYLVKDIQELEDTLKKAYHVAQSGRPGPVLVDIPKDIFLTKVDYKEVDTDEFVDFVEGKIKNEDCYDEELIEIIAEKINNSKKPVIFAGGGVIISGNCDKLQELASKNDIPVTNSLMGLGSISRKDRLSLGLLGMHGSREANLAVHNSDLVLAIGARFSDRVIGKADSFAKNAKIIHIDIDESEVCKNIGVDNYAVGDIGIILQKLIECVDKKDRKEWLEEILNWRSNSKNSEEEFIPQNIIKMASEKLGENAIVATDVGQHQMWTAQHWDFIEPKTFVTSGGLGTMGFGLGAAIGSQIGKPDKRTILVTGDGSFRMNCNELATVRKWNLPIIILLFNNSALGMVRQWQRLFQDEKYSETDMGDEVDYIKLAEAYHIDGYRVCDIESFENVLEKVCKTNEPVLIECSLNKNACVFPIVPPGKPIDKLVTE
ncbi:acetolactate synthase large subunit IlvB [Gottschalkia acidurici 9a]|uniref:Acetolactate synthase n=1 Tax=Gottschalkia acidurici (strain ATCC 7906 / DSM 604 / BCRC 14475 / CIP 104303 / KCTC 5404 / NCIMB 10678 / 9a) TaxID=1128398 RepID=K0AZN8_GOTA9|nr:biosynthetic-type acetolactate synthase large subunit [Gottschalkia acidurici]AFS78247.1 acetolactate synthase large subunit IlvB [Gottschalkia acidurici 9a]